MVNSSSFPLCKLTVVAILLASCHGYPSGAPRTSCVTMKPNHPGESQTSEPPYSISVDKASVNAGGRIKVTVSSKKGTSFKGLLLQARGNAMQDIVGTFSDLSYKSPNSSSRIATKALRTLDCNGPDNAVTHATKEEKIEVSAVWTAPKSNYSSVKFRATVVQSYQVFWHGAIHSDEVAIAESSAVSSLRPHIRSYTHIILFMLTGTFYTL